MGVADDLSEGTPMASTISNTFTSNSKTSLLVTFLLSFATFNIRGLGLKQTTVHDSKREQLGLDCVRYKVDLCAVQETKVVEPGECTLSNGYRLIWFGQNDGRHGGLGFVLSPRIMNYVVCWKYISDRVCYMDLEFPSRSGKSVRCRIVNAYGPHKKLAHDNPQLVDNFYGQLKDAITVPSNVEIFVLGDFNSKLGRMTHSDCNYGLNTFMGNYGVGMRNDMGENLLNFLSENHLFATNTSFQHPSRHITTFTGWRKDWSAGRYSKKTLPVYSQIDYVLCRVRTKPMLQDSRSYAGCRTFSDHRLVITRVNFKNISLCYKRKPQSAIKFNTSELASNSATQTKYHQCPVGGLESWG